MDARYETYMGRGPKQIIHWEHWSNPDAETYLTGIDYYAHPRLCRQRMRELYPEIELSIPDKDDPKPRPEDQADQGKGRWGDSYRDHWQQDVASSRFGSLEDMLRFSPLAQADFTGWHVVEDGDYRDEETIYARYRRRYPQEWGDRAPVGSSASVFFYNTMFMWPMLTFGYENFMMLCLEPEFDRLMDEFAEINRRVFRAFARLPVNFVICHDDIVLANGPVCSPDWMKKHIFPRYEEFWSVHGLQSHRAPHPDSFIAEGDNAKHLDPVWLWDWREAGLNEGIITTAHLDRAGPDGRIPGPDLHARRGGALSPYRGARSRHLPPHAADDRGGTLGRRGRHVDSA
jgi:hypothetical protein